MLDSIVIRASSLNAKDALQDKFKSYNMVRRKNSTLFGLVLGDMEEATGMPC